VGGGLIVVFKNYSATTEGVVQKAFVNKNESQRAFLSSVLASLSNDAKTAGDVLTFRLLSPQASIRIFRNRPAASKVTTGAPPGGLGVCAVSRWWDYGRCSRPVLCRIVPIAGTGWT
jgi:hypothetical protein